MRVIGVRSGAEGVGSLPLAVQFLGLRHQMTVQRPAGFPAAARQGILDVMTDPQRRWDWSLGTLASAWWTAATLPMNTGAAALYQAVFIALRTVAVGRNVTARLGDGELRMKISTFTARPDVFGLSVGKLGQAYLAVQRLQWKGIDFDSAGATLHNMRIKPSVPPMLTAGPIDFSIDVPSAAINPLLRNSVPLLTGAVDPDGVATIGLARIPGLHVEVDVELDGSTLWLTPRKLAVLRARIPLPRRVRSVPIHLPDLPNGLTLTSVSVESEALRLGVSLPEWQMDVPRVVLDEAANQLGVMGRPLDWF